MQKFKSGDKVYYQSTPVEVVAAKKDFKTNKCTYVIQVTGGTKLVNEAELLSYDEFMEVVRNGEDELDNMLTKLTKDGAAKDDFPTELDTYELTGEEDEEEEEEEEALNKPQLSTDPANDALTPVRRRGGK